VDGIEFPKKVFLKLNTKVQKKGQIILGHFVPLTNEQMNKVENLIKKINSKRLTIFFRYVQDKYKKYFKSSDTKDNDDTFSDELKDHDASLCLLGKSIDKALSRIDIIQALDDQFMRFIKVVNCEILSIKNQM
jgi:hypothetical protein